ncbi:sensor domain-containing diguanylate cyclase [Methylomonas methanica]|uniref:diguanylate cyclase n=1 Tax=Methylomonas methanica (strain DSM 25384 / MC09) TaxID=857087 RepID=G0A4B2_METMM|nr:diguanylate cyclase [Methylomonas methanica]AEG00328.1 diguanylate cyclase with PAS/PAC sensor [Methylomonas methanica MC09]
MSTKKSIAIVVVFWWIFACFFFFSYTLHIQQRLESTQKELIGLSKIKSLNLLNKALQRYRGLYPLDPEQAADGGHIHQRLIELRQTVSSVESVLNDAKTASEIDAVFSSKDQEANLFDQITMLIEKNNQQLRIIADKYELLYEPDRENFILLELVLYTIPDMIESAAKSKAIATRAHTVYERPNDLSLIDNNLYVFSQAFHNLKLLIDQFENYSEFIQSVAVIEQEYQDYYQLLTGVSEAKPLGPGLFLFSEGTRLVDASYALAELSRQKLKANFQQRLVTYSQLLRVSYAALLIGLTLSIYVYLRFYRRSKIDRQLAASRKINEDRVNDLRKALHNLNTLQEICNHSLRFIAQHLSAVSGVLFIHNEKIEQLNLSATFGVNPKSVKHKLKIGEGPIGQCVLDARIYESTINQESNPSSVNIGITNANVKKILTFPLVNLGSTVGVIQLLLLEGKPIEHETVSQFADVMASYIDKEKKYDESKKYFASINKNVITSSTDAKGVITQVSQAFADISGYTKEELIGQKHSIIRHPDMPAELFKDLWSTITKGNTWNHEVKNRTKDGGFYWVDVTISPDLDFYGNIIGYTAIRHDITEKKKNEEIAITDGLTQIYNRRHFDTCFELKIREMRRDMKPFLFAMLDIDFFKQYNDNYGHQQGDNVLISIANTLKHCLRRPRDMVFRLGGEEFGFICDADSLEDAIKICEAVRETVESLKISHQYNAAAAYVTISSGVIFITPDTRFSPEHYYKAADEMLYQAKTSGRNNVKLRTL